MKQQKKAQTEMVGLVILIILISLGVLFVVQFMVKDTARQTQESARFQKSDMAKGIVMTLLKTTSNCDDINKYSFEDLYKDCARGGFIECTTGENSCEYINESLQTILNSTLNNWYVKDYIFTAKVMSNKVTQATLTNIISGDCSGKNREGYDVPIPLFTTGNNILIFLGICY